MIQYFLADFNESQASLENLRKMGLAYAFEVDSPLAKRPVMANGPNDGAGLCVSTTDNGIGYFPENQTWKKHATVDNVWIGITRPMDPESLIRSDWKGSDLQPLITRSWPLATEGETWPVPCAMHYVAANQFENLLPTAIEWTGAAFVEGGVKSRYKRLSEIGESLAENYLKKPRQLPGDYQKLAFELLSLVYRIGPDEFAMLGLVGWSADDCFKLFRLVLDFPGLQERAKKKTDTTPDDLSSGDAA